MSDAFLDAKRINQYVVFDLETTDKHHQNAEIIQIAALHPDKDPFTQFVATEKPIADDALVWSITKIDKDAYYQACQPKAQVLKAFLAYIGDHPLAGHNIRRFDLPLLTRSLSEVDLELPNTSEPYLDTLQWALLCFPTPPEGLRGYKLGDLHHYLTGQEISGAHQADKDCEATRTIMHQLLKCQLEPEVGRLWHYLGLFEASFYERDAASKDDIQPLLQVRANVPHINEAGKNFPDVAHELAEKGTWSASMQTLLGSRREPQIDMIRIITEMQRKGGQALIQAPTGTGKTRAYLYPSHHLVTSNSSTEKVVVATHTKVLQQQAYAEMKRSAEQGFATKAVTVKSSRDYICLEALQDLLAEPSELSEADKPAVALLLHMVRRGEFDLESLPQNWQFDAAFREVRFQVQTNPSRCRKACPFFEHCAYQVDTRHRDEADFWITNQAWFISHFGAAEESDLGHVHLVIDEAHNLEDVATEALSHSVGQEDLRFHLNRIFNKPQRRGWLRDNRYVDEAQHALANRIRNQVMPNVTVKLAEYTKLLEHFIKQYGQGEPQFGVTLVLGAKFRSKREYPKLRLAEEALLKDIIELRKALLEFPRGGWLRQNLDTSIQFFQQFIDVVVMRRKTLADALKRAQVEAADSTEDTGDNPQPTIEAEAFVHLSVLDPNTGWSHVAQLIDVSEALERIWRQIKSVTLTSATLSVGGDFSYFERVLGLEGAQKRALPETLPYDQASVLIPSHLPEARQSNLRRFQELYHQELEHVLPQAGRSLSLFTSRQRMQEAGEVLERVPELHNLYIPLTRREREDIAQTMRLDGAAAALGTRAYMEGVDFPHLKVVNLERIPFPIPSALLQARQQHAENQGLDPWEDVYLPKALLSFTQAFGRLIRDDRQNAGRGVFILWDKRLSYARYQRLFFKTLPKGVSVVEASNRKDFYAEIAEVLAQPVDAFPQEDITTQAQKHLHELWQRNVDVESKIRELAKEYWSIDGGQLREQQWQAIHASLAGKDTLVLLPTGFGKSLTFQIPALLQEGLTLVVSPLIALMRDQVERLKQMDLPAAGLDSMLSGAERRAILREVEDGRVQLLYVSPERVQRDEALKECLRAFAARGRLHRVVLDEAHCLSEQGHDFRPDYLKVVKSLKDTIAPDLAISALTATATPRVQEDLRTHLSLRASLETIQASYDRPNISYFTYKYGGKDADVKKLQTLTQILGYVEQDYPDDSVIIYAATRRQVERLAWSLQALGYAAAAYHAGLSGLIRNEVQGRFNSGERKIIVATNAFGLGIDRKNVRVVVHFNPPLDIAAYVQEAGRAGRDQQSAFAVLFHSTQDWNFARWLAQREQWFVDHRDALLELFEEADMWRGYESNLAQAINQDMSEEQPEINRSALRQLLGAMETAGALTLEYHVGKASVLDKSQDGALEPHLPLLLQCGYQGKEGGDDIDFSKLTPDQAEQLNNHLFALDKQHQIVYAYYEPIMDLRRAPSLGRARSESNRQRKQHLQRRKDDVQSMRSYAETPQCKRKFLLNAFNETTETCCTCTNCAQASREVDETRNEPWLREKALDNDVLEQVYKPLDTLLRFLDAHQTYHEKYGDYKGLGKTRITMALQGREQQRIQTATVWLKYGELNNPFFGHLSFIKDKEVEKALKEAVKQRYLLEDGYEGNPIYRISDAGKDYLSKQNRSYFKRGNT